MLVCVQDVNFQVFSVEERGFLFILFLFIFLNVLYLVMLTCEGC